MSWEGLEQVGLKRVGPEHPPTFPPAPQINVMQDKKKTEILQFVSDGGVEEFWGLPGGGGGSLRVLGGPWEGWEDPEGHGGL